MSEVNIRMALCKGSKQVLAPGLYEVFAWIINKSATAINSYSITIKNVAPFRGRNVLYTLNCARSSNSAC